MKKKHLLKLVNYRRSKLNIAPVKSVTAIYNRSLSKNKRSLQAKRHLGLALFCCKKSPKSEGDSNILNHYCRSRKKNVSLQHCKGMKDLVLFRSFDDKAQLCPGTKTGMDSTRRQQVLTVCDNKLARKFKKYDFPPSMMSITPGVVLYMTKSIIEDDKGIPTLKVDSQDTVVAVKSKYFVGSSGSVWHGHLMENRHRESIIHEVPNEVSFDKYPICIRNMFCKLRDFNVSFMVQTMKKDILNVCGDNLCRQYELRKLMHLQKAYEQVLAFLIEFEPSDSESDVLDRLHLILTDNLNLCNDIIDKVENVVVPGKDLVQPLDDVKKSCKRLIVFIDSLGLPKYRPVIIDLTDAGPGVGINNKEVYYRIGNEILICGYDYYARIHLAPGDSSQNEVERLQSSVGDAIADGGYINWEHRKQFGGLSDEEVLKMNPAELGSYEVERMQYNAFTTADEITSRIDGNVAPNGYLKAYCSPKKSDLFFWDTEFLCGYIDKKVKDAPGYNFYNYIEQVVMDKHCRIGQKSLEFIKCPLESERTGDICSFCLENPVQEGCQVSRVPEPVPDYSYVDKFKYKQYDHPDNNGKLGPIDEFNPRVQLKAMFSDKKICLNSPDQIDAFSKKFIVDEDLVVGELTHLVNLDLAKTVRSADRERKKHAETSREYEDFNWKELVEEKKLKKLVVKTLNKYLSHHDISHFEQLKKAEKIHAITAHYYSLKYDSVASASNEDNGDKDHEDEEGNEYLDSDDDEVLNFWPFGNFMTV